MSPIETFAIDILGEAANDRSGYAIPLLIASRANDGLITPSEASDIVDLFKARCVWRHDFAFTVADNVSPDFLSGIATFYR